MAVILLALDESGKLDNTEDVVFGGCMFENSESHRFGKKWVGRLEASGIESLHMKDAMRCSNEFHSWRSREVERNTLLCDLAGLAAKSKPTPDVSGCANVYQRISTTTAERSAAPQKSRILRLRGLRSRGC
jgi:hypothetical protein